MKIFGLLALATLTFSLQAQAQEMYGYVSAKASSGQIKVEKKPATAQDRELLREELCDSAKQEARQKMDDDCRAEFGNDYEHGFTSEEQTIGSCDLKYDKATRTYSAEIEIQAKCSKTEY